MVGTEEAEALGMEFSYPGFAASDVLLNADGSAVTGIATRDIDIGYREGWGTKGYI